MDLGWNLIRWLKYDAEELLCRHTIVFIMVNILCKDHYNIRGVRLLFGKAVCMCHSWIKTLLACMNWKWQIENCPWLVPEEDVSYHLLYQMYQCACMEFIPN